MRMIQDEVLHGSQVQLKLRLDLEIEVSGLRTELEVRWTTFSVVKQISRLKLLSGHDAIGSNDVIKSNFGSTMLQVER
jgi:hypothetical protein